MNPAAAPAPPASAPAPVPVPAPAAGADWMVWALVGLLVLALAVAVVAAVLAARRRAAPPAEPGPFPERRRGLRTETEPEPEVIVPGYAAPFPQAPPPAAPPAPSAELAALAARVDRLEVELAALKARQIAAARAEPAPAPTAAPAPPPAPRLPEPAELERDYRVLLTDPSRRSFDAFIEDYDAVGLVRRGEAWGAGEPDDALVIAAPCRGGLLAFPGWGLVADMATSYYARRMLPDAVQALFLVDTDGSRTLKLLAAARLREGADGATLVRAGELGGFED